MAETSSIKVNAEAKNRPDDVLARITLSLNPGYKRRRDLLLVDLLPPNLGEPLMSEDILAAVLHVAITFAQIRRQAVSDNVYGQRVEERRVVDDAGDDLLIQLDVTARSLLGAGLDVERWVAREHFEDEDSD